MPKVFADLAAVCRKFRSAIVIGPARGGVWNFHRDSAWNRLVAGSIDAIGNLCIPVLDPSETFTLLPKQGLHFAATAAVADRLAQVIRSSLRLAREGDWFRTYVLGDQLVPVGGMPSRPPSACWSDKDLHENA